MKITHPDVRKNLEEFLGSLSNFEYQKDNWLVARESDRGDDLSMIAGFLFDDADFLENANRQVGYSLLDHIEADAVSDLSMMIFKFVENEGYDLSLTLLESRPWKEIVNRSQEILNMLIGGDHRLKQ